MSWDFDSFHGIKGPSASGNGAATCKASNGKHGKADRPSKAIGQRFETLNNFVDSVMKNFKPSTSIVWVVLYRDARNGIARTSQGDIARRSGLSVRQVRRALAELIESGSIRLLSRGNSFQQCSVYEVIGKPLTTDTHVRSTPDK